MSFTWIDWLLLAIIGISALISLRNGFFKEVLSLITWVVAIFIAWLFNGHASELLRPYIDTPSIRVVTASAVLFVATLIVGGLINQVFCRLVKATGLSGTDRLLGMVFGALRGCLLGVLLVGLMTLAPLDNDTAWQNSVLLPHFIMLADWTRDTAMSFAQPVDDVSF